MSVHAFTVREARRADDIVLACHDALRAPVAATYAGETLTLHFTPDLTAAEQTALSEIVRAGVSLLTRAERNALEPVVERVRTFRTRTVQQWNGLTNAQREADELQWLRDLTDVLRAILRD